MVDNACLDQFILVKYVSSLICILHNASDSLLDTTYTLCYVPHKVTASLRTRSRMRSRNPFSVTTSTLQPSKSSRSIRSPLPRDAQRDSITEQEERKTG